MSLNNKLDITENRASLIKTEFKFEFSFKKSKIIFDIQLVDSNKFYRNFVDFLNLLNELEYEKYIVMSSYEKLYFYNNSLEDYVPDLKLEAEVNELINNLVFEIFIRQDLLCYKAVSKFFNIKQNVISLLVL